MGLPDLEHLDSSYPAEASCVAGIIGMPTTSGLGLSLVGWGSRKSILLNVMCAKPLTLLLAKGVLLILVIFRASSTCSSHTFNSH